MSPARASSTHRESLFEAEWQPIGMLPVIGAMIENWLEDVDVQYHTLEKCRPTPHVLDDYTVGRVIEVYSVQRDDVPLFDEQLRRWRALGLTRAEREEVERVSGLMLRVKDRIAAILALAGELKERTIERVLARSDFELGLEFRRKVKKVAEEAGPAPESGLSAAQIKTAQELDARALDILREGGDDIRLLSRMHDDLARFWWLMETAGDEGMDQLCARFIGLCRYAEALEWFMAALESGEVEVSQ